MKERILQFYSDHTTACNIVASGGVLMGAMFLTKKVRGYQPVSADIWDRGDGTQLLTVNQKNGNSLLFQRSSVTEVAA